MQIHIKHVNAIMKTISSVFVLCTLFIISGSSNICAQVSTLKTVVLDAGHGGKDPGNLGTGRYKDKEKEIALKVVLKLGQYIEETYPDIKVLYTRKTDVFVPLHKRTEIANKNKADLFISVHCNGLKRTDVYGTETFVMGTKYEKTNLELTKMENSVIYLEDDYEENYNGLDPENPESNIIAAIYQNAYLAHSISFANYVEKQFAERVGRRSRGVKQSVLFVMNRTTMPSALIELGFLSNNKEEDFLNSENGQVYMASAIFRAFKEYKSQLDAIDNESRVNEAPIIVKEETLEKFEEDNPYGIEFYIQLMASKKPVSISKTSLSKIDGVKELHIGSVYKYVKGSYSSYNDAKKALKKLKKSEFASAFVIALKNDEIVPIKTAIKESK